MSGTSTTPTIACPDWCDGGHKRVVRLGDAVTHRKPFIDEASVLVAVTAFNDGACDPALVDFEQRGEAPWLAWWADGVAQKVAEAAAFARAVNAR